MDVYYIILYFILYFLSLGLSWYQAYEIQICGKTSAGAGVCSNPITVSTDEWSKNSLLFSVLCCIHKSFMFL